MFISALDLFKIGIGPSSSHTTGPMVAAHDFIERIKGQSFDEASLDGARLRCTLKGSLSFTGKGHSTDRAVALGGHGYLPASLVETDVQALVDQLWQADRVALGDDQSVLFNPPRT